MTGPALRRTLGWLPVLCLAAIAAALTAIPGNTVTFLLNASQAGLPWVRP